MVSIIIKIYISIDKVPVAICVCVYIYILAFARNKPLGRGVGGGRWSSSNTKQCLSVVVYVAAHATDLHAAPLQLLLLQMQFVTAGVADVFAVTLAVDPVVLVPLLQPQRL
jgi:hypothetical protein